MNNQLFIHTGYPKTATTFLQHQIFERIPNVNYSHPFNDNFIIKKNQVNIISDESLTGLPYQGGKATDQYLIADKIKKIFPDANIIVTTRESDSWLHSLYSQYIRNGGTQSYEGWFENIFDKEYLNQKGYVKYMEKRFLQVLQIDFSDFYNNKQEVIRKLFDFLHVDAFDYKDIRYNTRLSDFQHRVIRFLNRFWYSSWNPNRILPKRKFFNPEFFGELFDFKKRFQEKKS